MHDRYRLTLPLYYMAALFLISSIPGDVLEVAPGFRWVTPAWQNLLHVPVFGGLAFSWFWALETPVPTLGHRLWAAFGLTMAYAFVDESWQLLIPGRYGSLTDLCLNATGAAIALGLIARRLRPSDRS